jgi:hypothetical protein
MVISIFIKWGATLAKWWRVMLINEEREGKLKKSFLLQGTTSSLVPTHIETIEFPLGRNDLFPRLTSTSGVLQLYLRPRSSCAQPRRLHDDELWWASFNSVAPPWRASSSRAPPRAPAVVPRRARSGAVSRGEHEPRPGWIHGRHAMGEQSTVACFRRAGRSWRCPSSISPDTPR